jgi:hypothetical protein
MWCGPCGKGQGGATLGDLAEMHGEMRGNFCEEYDMHGLNQLALAHAHPLVAKLFGGGGYSPLQDPTRGVEAGAHTCPLFGST